MRKETKPLKPAWKEKHSLIETEKDLQKTCIDYLEKVVGDRCRYYVRKDKRENLGDLGYCPDLIVWVKYAPKFCTVEKIVTLLFEFKSPKGTGRLTKKQDNFWEWVCECEHDFYIENDFEKFKNVIDWHLKRSLA